MHTSSLNSCGIPVATGCLITNSPPAVSWLNVTVSLSTERMSKEERCSFGMQCSFNASGFSGVNNFSCACNCGVVSCKAKSVVF